MLPPVRSESREHVAGEMRRMTSIVVAIVGLYVAVVVAAYVRQRSMMYFPDAQRVQPARSRSMHEEIFFPSGDGVNLVGWYRAAAPGEPTVLYFPAMPGRWPGGPNA